MSETVDTKIGKGHQARREGRPMDAEVYFSEALVSARESGASTETLARALTGLAQVQRDLKRNDDALRHYNEVAKLYEQVPDPLRWAHTIRHMADIHRNNGSLEQSGRCYEQALATYRRHNETPPLDLANTLRGYALLSEAVGNAEQAESFWREACELYQAVDVQPGVQECTARLHRLNRSAAGSPL